MVAEIMSNRNEIIEQILENELAMFRSVSTCGPNQCLENPQAFKLHRKAQFCIFSTKTLQSYQNDIERAQKNNRNLMTYKYARMDNLIPRVNDSFMVNKVATIMIEWQLQLETMYPEIMKRARPITSEKSNSFETSFETYLKAELETYSSQTLDLLYQDLSKLKAEGKNGSEEIYRFLVKEGTT